MVTEEITLEEQLNKLEKQITDVCELFDYRTEEIWVEKLINLKTEPLDDKDNEYLSMSKSERSALIEALIIKVPLPLIVLSEQKDGSYKIKVGEGVIYSIFDFMSGVLTIEGRKELTELNGLTFIDLTEYRKRKIRKTNIRVTIISYN